MKVSSSFSTSTLASQLTDYSHLTTSQRRTTRDATETRPWAKHNIRRDLVPEANKEQARMGLQQQFYWLIPPRLAHFA
jgi:hypothetical protein